MFTRNWMIPIPTRQDVAGIHYPRCPECGGSMNRSNDSDGYVTGPWVCMEPTCGWDESKNDGEVVWIGASELRHQEAFKSSQINLF